MKRKFTAFYAVMIVLFALTVAGCSDNGGGTAYYSPFSPTPVPSPTPTPEPSPTPPEPEKTASIKFQFMLEMARTTVPYTVFSFNFEGFNADGDSIYSKDVDKDEVTSEGQMQTVLLTDVPVDVTSIIISYFAEDGELVAQSFIEDLELVPGADPIEIVVADKAPITESKLSVKFELAALPNGAVQYYVKALDNLDNITGESEKMDVPDAAGDMETYVFDEVALNTNRVEVYWIDDTGVEICVSKADVEELETGGDAEVVIKETAVLVTRFSASVINTYTFDAEPSSVNAIVYYNSSEGENISTTVSDVDFDNAAGTAEFDVPAQGENIEVLSFVLTSDTDCAFEWFDYDDPQAAAQGEAVAADVAEITPFQGGTGTEADPYLIANPAQLDRVRDDVSETAYYKVVKDMDFHYAGGIDVTKGEDGRAELETIDENARFYATEADYIHGWLPIGVYSVNAAKGEVANCEGVYFNGNFDGGNFTIDGLEIWASKEYGATGVGGDHGLTVGLFGQCVSAHISNVKIGENSAIHADSDQQLRVGAVIGGCMNQNNYLFGKSNGALNSLRTFVTDCSNAGYVQGEGGY
ncbi:MAG: hypothetical protein K6G50_08990, partial [bacterium]|nr:hypothetical protein [bacterium]